MDKRALSPLKDKVVLIIELLIPAVNLKARFIDLLQHRARALASDIVLMEDAIEVVPEAHIIGPFTNVSFDSFEPQLQWQNQPYIIIGLSQSHNMFKVQSVILA